MSGRGCSQMSPRRRVGRGVTDVAVMLADGGEAIADLAGQLAWLEARHRAHARVEDRIHNLKQTGIGRFRPESFGSIRPGCSSR